MDLRNNSHLVSPWVQHQGTTDPSQLAIEPQNFGPHHTAPPHPSLTQRWCPQLEVCPSFIPPQVISRGFTCPQLLTTGAPAASPSCIRLVSPSRQLTASWAWGIIGPKVIPAAESITWLGCWEDSASRLPQHERKAQSRGVVSD